MQTIIELIKLAAYFAALILLLRSYYYILRGFGSRRTFSFWVSVLGVLCCLCWIALDLPRAIDYPPPLGRSIFYIGLSLVIYAAAKSKKDNTCRNER